MMKKLLPLLLLLLIIGCRQENDARWGGVPASKYEDVDKIIEDGTQTYAEQNKKWYNRRKAHNMWRKKRSDLNDIISCGGLEQDDPVLVEQVGDILIREKLARESNGGPGCRCMPMGETCYPKTCYCDEICPNDNGILQGRANRMEPSEEHTLNFTNSSSYNNSVYKKYPLTGGYCTGHNVITKKFAMLADYQPDLFSRPKLKKGTPEWEDYIVGQIAKIKEERKPEFVGLAGFHELCTNEKFKEAMSSKLGWGFAGGDCTKRSYWRDNASVFKTRKLNDSFKHPTGEDFPARKAKDPATGDSIPPEGTDEYQEYVEKKVRKISRGEPAAIPGYKNLRELSKNPAVAEILGEEVAINWRTYNTFRYERDDEANGSMHYTAGKEVSDLVKPMNAKQKKTLVAQARALLPTFPADYPKGPYPGEPWNGGGPFQTMTMSYYFADNSPEGYGGHSIEAWAVFPQSDGSTRICVRDPNHNQAGMWARDKKCKNYINIPKEGDPTYTDGPIAQFNFDSHNQGLIGSSVEKLVQYCRKTKKSNFKGGQACSE
jgi:hypothetical protein